MLIMDKHRLCKSLRHSMSKFAVSHTDLIDWEDVSKKLEE